MARVLATALILLVLATKSVKGAQISEDTLACLACHIVLMPGIYGDWRQSRHSNVTPVQALSRPSVQRRMSTDKLDPQRGSVVVGCAECHVAREGHRTDAFEHNGFRVHTVVTPQDCRACHPDEVKEFEENLMSHAYGNLAGNELFSLLAKSINGLHALGESGLTQTAQDELTLADSCLSCHGSKIEIAGFQIRETSMGPMDFPRLKGWPNQGVGRVNPDGSKGSCSACHTRHSFSIEVARKPDTCSQCHKGPDVPAYSVFQVSKHGNIYSSGHRKWDFEEVPWIMGEHIRGPTCATCHVSLLVDPEGSPIAKRTHRMNDRLPWRLFGLIYSHPHPISPDTTRLTNSLGLPLPTELTGGPIPGATIDENEASKRLQAMKAVCAGCHSAGWIDGHFQRLENTIFQTNESTRVATKILMDAWNRGLASKDNPFDELIESKWIKHWLFFSNSTRFASAMGGADYGVFANGRWHLSNNIVEMWEWVRAKEALERNK